MPDNTVVPLPVHVRDLNPDDLEWIGWSGGPNHVKYVAEALRLVERGDMDYLAVCGPPDEPLSIGGIDYRPTSGGGTLCQLATYPTCRSHGLGSLLIGACEARIRQRGLETAYLDVEEENRAESLYQRLGYQAYGKGRDAWDVLDDSGNLVRHQAVTTRMRKRL